MKINLVSAGRKCFLESDSYLPILISIVATICLLYTYPAKATLLHVNAQATFNNDFVISTNYIPLGTVVNASATFDVPPGLPATPATSGVVPSTGTFEWDNGGPQVFTVTSAQQVGAVDTGLVDYSFYGTGPIVGNYQSTLFGITFDIGTNPFTTTSQLADLLAGSTIDSLDMQVTNINDGSEYGAVLNANVSGAVAVDSVPEPRTLVLVGLGLLSLVYIRYVSRGQSA
jgi:hypothetical protein